MRYGHVTATIILLATSAFAVQERSTVLAGNRAELKAVNISHVSPMERPVAGSPQQENTSGIDFSKYLPLLQELGQLQEKMQQEIKYPAPRSESKLLPLLPASTSLFAALPNYGDSLHQAVQIFHRELQEREVLRNQWQSFPAGPIVEDALEKVYQFSQYLGSEVVISAEIKTKGGSPLILAEVRKPGLKAFLDGQVKQFSGPGNGPVRILNPQELLTAKARSSTQAFVLVRPDVLVIAFDLATLKSFNAQLSRPGGKLAPTPFGQRLAQAYQDGTGIVFAADLQKIKNLIPFSNKRDEASFRQTGLADVKYLVAEHKDVAGQTSNNLELTFTGPRHGIASWLAAPAPMGGLDFISTDAAYVSALSLKSPAQIFDDIKDIAEASRPGASQGLAQAEGQFNIKFKEDLLSKLGGEIILAVDGPTSPTPSWKAVLQVKDPEGLQKTLQRLLEIANGFMKGEQQPNLKQQTERGQAYYSLQIPGAQKPIEVDYAFADGYMVLGGSHALVAEALRIHRNGESLAKSSAFQALLPRDHSKDSSAVLYQNFARMIGPMLQQVAPELAQMLEGTEIPSTPIATFAFADENAIRVTSNNNQGAEVATALIVAAIAIPNLMRSKAAANEAGAAATVRTLTTAEITYATTYPKKGFTDLASVGPPDSSGGCTGGPTEDHACLIDSSLGCASGTSGEWCVKGSYRYSITTTCKEGPCEEYVILATPVSRDKGGKNFCSVPEGIIRFQTGPPLTAPVTASECANWTPL